MTCYDKPLPRPLHIWPQFVSQHLLVIQIMRECQRFSTFATLFISHISFSKFGIQKTWHASTSNSADFDIVAYCDCTIRVYAFNPGFWTSNLSVWMNLHNNFKTILPRYLYRCRSSALSSNCILKITNSSDLKTFKIQSASDVKIWRFTFTFKQIFREKTFEIHSLINSLHGEISVF